MPECSRGRRLLWRDGLQAAMAVALCGRPIDFAVLRIFSRAQMTAAFAIIAAIVTLAAAACTEPESSSTASGVCNELKGAIAIAAAIDVPLTLSGALVPQPRPAMGQCQS